MKIGLLSDTHSFLDPKIFDYFSDCDEVWHAGDIGNMDVCDQLSSFKPLVAVYGNIDDQKTRSSYPENQVFEREGFKIWITHIGGYPPRYNPTIKKKLIELKPDIFVCGHSHILKVISDPKLNNLLHLNPGACGKHGFHQVKTLLRFDLNNKKISNMQVIELGKRA
jgi:putative phosphoesterase